MERLNDAVASYEQAVAINPHYLEAHINLGSALKELRRPADALISFDHALTINPERTEIHAVRGRLLMDLNRLEEALCSYDRAIDVDPDDCSSRSNRAAALMGLKRLEEAVAGFDQAIALKPDYAEAYNNRGIALKELNRQEEALASYDRAITLNPVYAEAYSNRGNLLKNLHRFDDALASYDKAIAINADFGDAYWNKAYLKILLGDYAEGWRLYEWRWKAQKLISSRVFEQPLWLGETSLADKTLLIHPEQGFGDYLQFIRYALLAEPLAAKVVLEVPAALMSVVATLPGRFERVEAGRNLPEFDCHCPVMSLPLAFKTVLDTIPALTPYLQVDSVRRQRWRQRLGEKTKFRVGLVWSGSTGHKQDQHRSLSIKQLASWLDLPLEFHSLQKEIRPGDAEFIARTGRISLHQEWLTDFAETAALLAEMDLIISVDTSVAHLAGALGKQVWILLSYAPDFRWLLDRQDSPWYPTATLFRQTALSDWDGVLAEMAGRLQELATS
jgi:hypothetical protein